MSTIINHPAVAIPYARAVAADYARETENRRRVRIARIAKRRVITTPEGPRRRITWPWQHAPGTTVTA